MGASTASAHWAVLMCGYFVCAASARGGIAGGDLRCHVMRPEASRDDMRIYNRT